MKIVTSIAAVAMIVAGCTGTIAAELPSFEAAGFPISPVQAQLLGAANVNEPSPALTAGSILTPHQAAVLTPRALEVARATPTTSSGTRLATP